MKDILAIIIILGIPLGMLLGVSLAGCAILGGFFGILNYIKNKKNSSALAVWPTLLSIAGIFVGIYMIYFIVTLCPRWNAAVMRHDKIESFAGCGRDNHDSYSYKTDEEVDRILKILNISKKDFEKRKNECIKNIQMNSFAGCLDKKYPWKKGTDMDEQEFNDTLKYFDISKKTFDAVAKLCENHNQIE